MCNDEKSNGLELWRQLVQEVERSYDYDDRGVRQLLNPFPRCSNFSKLPAHLDEWKSLLERFGSDLIQLPNQLWVMILEMIPADMENEIVDDKDIKTYGKSHCKKKAALKLQKKKQQRLKQQVGKGHHVNAIVENHPNVACTCSAQPTRHCDRDSRIC